MLFTYILTTLWNEKLGVTYIYFWLQCKICTLGKTNKTLILIKHILANMNYRIFIFSPSEERCLILSSFTEVAEVSWITVASLYKRYNIGNTCWNTVLIQNLNWPLFFGARYHNLKSFENSSRALWKGLVLFFFSEESYPIFQFPYQSAKQLFFKYFFLKSVWI